ATPICAAEEPRAGEGGQQAGASMRRHLSTRERARLFALHGGICHFCLGKIHGEREAWDISHVIPLAAGGADTDENTKPAHRKCHRAHTAAVDMPRIAKTKRQAAMASGAKARPRQRLCYRRFDGTPVNPNYRDA